jgi:predicted AAA+ superfamily ATPase
MRAATPGETDKPTKETAMSYRDLLQRLWVLDPLPAWVAGYAHLTRLGQAPKHHLVDPALAARLVGVNRHSLIRGAGPGDGTFLGALFESLAVQTVRTLAQILKAQAFHLRVDGGTREIDIILETADRRVLAIETKISAAVRPADVAHLNWLENELSEIVVDKVILNTGDRAYRRKDGVAVVPLALLGL